MKLAQTNLSKLAENRPAVAKRLDCGVFSAAFPRLRPSRHAKSVDQSPPSRRFAPFAAFDGARLWSKTQPQRAASTERVGNFVSAAAGASHTAALRTKA